MEPVLARLAARAPTAAAALGYVAEGAASGCRRQLRSAYQAYAKGDTEKAINDWAEAFISTVMAVYGPCPILQRKFRSAVRTSKAAARRRCSRL